MESRSHISPPPGTGRSPLWRVPILILATLLLAAPSLHADLRLTEALAVNSGTSGYLDDDGTPQGWIEIWNTDTSNVVSLSSYRLSNGTTAWSFPAVQIMPDERIVVWASGKNRNAPTAPLHTNFTLPAGGGSIYLLNGGTGATDGTLISRLQNIPALPADVSWGRDEWDTATTPTVTGFYTTPTPGERNNYAGTGVAGAVSIDTPSKAFTGSLSVSLSTPSPTAQIRYTTDLSVPTASSTLYTGPLNLSLTTMIRARAFDNGVLPGATATEAYLLLSTQAAAFSTTMPLVVVSNFTTSAPSTNKSDQAAFIWTWEPPDGGGTVSMTDAPSFTSRVKINRRGSSTLGNAKYNLSMEIRNPWDDDDADAPLLGMPSDSDWVLEAPYDFDRALIRDPLAYALSNSIGRYAPRNVMAEVFLEFSSGSLNYPTSGSGDYYGVYNILEKIRRSKGRQNVAKLTTYDNDVSRKTGGYIWKVDRADSSVDQFSAGGVSSFVYDYPKGEDLKSPQRDPQEQYLTQDLNALYLQILSGNRDPQTGYPSLLDVSSAIDHHLLNTWCFNVDGLRLSAFWHKDRDGRVQAGPAWDFDRSMSSTDGRDSNPAQWRANSGDGGTDFFNDTNCIWWYYLFRDADFYQAYIDRWQELRRGAFSASSVNTLIDSLNGQISSDAVARDLKRWQETKRSWTSPFTGVRMTGQAAEIQRIKDYLQQRANFFDSQWEGPVTASLPSGHVAAGTTVTLSGPAGATIYYTLDGSDPRPSGGASPSGSAVKTYSGPIAVSGVTHVRARAYDASHTALTGSNNPPLVSKWSGITDTTYSDHALATAGSIAITEVNFNPATPTTAELAQNASLTANSFEFLELRNVSATTVDLAGTQLTAGVTYTFPSSAPALAPGAFVIVAADPSALALRYPGITALGPWTGNLSNTGETVTLAALDSSVIASLTYDPAWSSLANGQGYTLVAYDSSADAASYGLAGNWRTSQNPLGSPGLIDPRSKAALPSGTALLHYWNFNTAATLLQPAQSVNGGTLSISTSSADTVYLADSGQNFSADNARNSDAPGTHLRVNFPLNATLNLKLPTTGYQNIVVRYETRRSGSGAGQQDISYTIDGTTFQPFTTLPPPDGVPVVETLDFSSVPGVSNNPSFGLRITFEQGAGSNVGNNRFDDFTVDGVALPQVNQPPAPTAAIPAFHELAAASVDDVVDLSSYFKDADGDALTYTASVTPTNVATASVSGASLHLTGVKQGNATLTITANDGHNAGVPVTIPLLIDPAPVPLVSKDLLFTSWDASQPDGAFPANMIFLQGQTSDSTLTTPLINAYTIPAADYASADAGHTGFPYMNTSRTRINGLGTGGISFINTGRTRDLGAALAALDTRQTSAVQVSWTAGTVTANPRIYALRLQARTSLSAAFEDVTDAGGLPIDYVAAAAGDRKSFGPVQLPAKYLGQANLQLIWRYYLPAANSGLSGARSEISLDDIVITGGSPHSYAAWRYSNYGVADRDNDAVSGPAANSNLLRYALGIAPGQPLEGALPTAVSPAGIRFRFNADKTDLIYRVTRSVDLATWSATVFDSSQQSWQSLSDGAGNLVVPDPSAPNPDAFYRLEVDLQQ